MSTGGTEFYQKAMIELDPDALGSDTMKEAFDRMATLRSYVDDNFSGRDWNLATAMVIEGQAGMQMMGDWAKGEFLNAGKQPGVDFVCFRHPGTQGTVTFNADQFAMFAVGEERRSAQEKLASAIMSTSFQSAFNVVKGSVPARTDVSDEAFDDCGKKGMKDLAEANANGTLYGSIRPRPREPGVGEERHLRRRHRALQRRVRFRDRRRGAGERRRSGDVARLADRPGRHSRGRSAVRSGSSEGMWVYPS